MRVHSSCFQFEDFLGDALPLPGYYPCGITSARFRRSANDNRMLQVVYALEGVGSACPMVADCFVLEGPRISPAGIVLSRRRWWTPGFRSGWNTSTGRDDPRCAWSPTDPSSALTPTKGSRFPSEAHHQPPPEETTMSRNTCTSVAATYPLPTLPAAGSFSVLPLEQLRTRYAALRPGSPQRAPEEVAVLPIRVVHTEEGLYEVLNGFKRLQAWREQGHRFIPVVIEFPCSTAEHKRLLLRANCPDCTLTALDEARVVCSLMSQEGLSPARIARQLERKPQWVARRVDIATPLSPTAENSQNGRLS